jgi:hypothetical protein
MKKKLIFPLAVLGILCLIAIAIVAIPNRLGNHIVSEAKANGIIEYKPVEAYVMAKRICTQCHTDERIKKYCDRCGPPFIAVVPHMQTFIENYKVAKPGLQIENITEHQGATIVQVWNAIIGNWEKDFRKDDILKLIGPYEELKALYATPVEKRPIEAALMGREDLKIGYMADMKKTMAKETLKKEKGADGTPDESQHSGHDHSKHDHSEHMHNK